MRRGEIAITVIIVIALGLLVLIILGAMLVNVPETIDGNANSCAQTYRGSCDTVAGCQAQGGRIVAGVTCGGQVTNDYGDGWEVNSYPAGGAVCCVTD